MTTQDKDKEETQKPVDSTSLPQEEKKLIGEVDEARELKQEIEKATKERDEYLNGWRRAKADLLNYKKDELKRLEEVARFGNEDLVRELVSILDSFDLALVALERSGPVEKGVYLIKSRLEDILKQRGLQRIETKTGQKFDPVYHEAIGAISDPTAREGAVAEEIEAGYLLHGKVIRPARVKVYAKGKE